MKNVVYYLVLLSGTCCKQSPTQQKQIDEESNATQHSTVIYTTIQDIPPPSGYNRVNVNAKSFQYWLRTLPLKKNKTVYLYNGKVKPNQSAQFAVIDIDRSKTDLQQCADAVMRLRAEYLFSQQQYDLIRFMDFNNKWYNWKGGNSRPTFDRYLQEVFGCCGSASLEKQLRPVNDFTAIKSGDVLIKGGFPGHAVIVADMAIDSKGKKVFMLVQGYQPAQDIHLLINPIDATLSPWYNIPNMNNIITPEWIFNKQQLKAW
ncbi:MAG: DUF4846 domain-containing protein [Chitinophagaceae bacterium]